MSSATLQDIPSVESFFNLAETETLALFEYLSFEFLEEFDVFAPAETGRTRDHEPPELMRGFLHWYYHDIYGIRPVEREVGRFETYLSQKMWHLAQQIQRLSVVLFQVNPQTMERYNSFVSVTGSTFS